VNTQGQVFINIHGPVEFAMGSPEGELRREPLEPLHQHRIDRSFAVGIHEVTAEQYQRFQKHLTFDRVVCPDKTCPAGAISWLDAIEYCRWLSDQEHVPEDQQCYPPLDKIRQGDGFHPEFALPANMLSRTGYRLPTEAEWEYVCRARTSTRYYFGDDERHMSDFGWWVANSQERTWPVGNSRPNPLGLFDLEGNVHEWCQDEWGTYPMAVNGQPVSISPAEVATPDSKANQRVFRGACYRSPGRAFRSAQRYEYPLGVQYSNIGFRLARTLPAKDK
jgi:formylglycine-generating enzyme required for sulfatase activity